MDDHGYSRKYAGRRAKPETYASRAKKAEMERSRQLANGGSTPQQKLAQKFRVPSVVRKTDSELARSQDGRNSKPRTPKPDSDSENEENRPSQTQLTSYSDEEEDERRAGNDIKPTNWTPKQDGQSKSRAKKTDTSSKKSFKRLAYDKSESDAESKPRSSQTSVKGVKTEKSEKKAFIRPPPMSEDEPVKKFKAYGYSPSPEPEEKAATSRSFVKLEVTGSPQREPEKKKFVAYKFEEEVEVDEEAKKKERKKAITRAAILREVGGSPNSIKRALIDAGLGEGLDQVENKDIWRSPPKKIASANQGRSSLAARIANRRIKEEPQEIKDEEVDDLDVFADSDQASCPMCHEAVPSSLLMAFSNNRPRSLNTRQQAAFCVHHKRDSALMIYKKQGYPDVHWDSFNSRLTAHYTYISLLITSPSATPSYYRPLFASDITYGRNRTLKQSIMGAKGEGSSTGRILTPGYYGPRGAQAIQQAIMLNFNRELRKAAVEDHVVSARAVGGYVASVLVPELGTRLIMEDMGIDEEAARKVMEDSAALGSLVNEELKDVRSDADRSIIEEGDDYD